jgi:hypothetical protein
MTAQPSPRPAPIQSVTISRADRGWSVAWQRDGRPTRREFGDLGSAVAHAYQLAALHDLAVLDLSGDPQ